MLEMKPQCERCGVTLKAEETAYICSYECTFCENCTRWFQRRCPNCSGELMPRPRRSMEAVMI